MPDRPRSPGFATDLALLGFQGSTVEEREGYLVVRTPANPTYHWGNCLILDRAPEPGSLASWVATFDREHRGAGHVAIGIDDPATSIDATEAAAARLEAERDVVLTASTLEAPAEIDGIELRALDTGRDEAWADLVTMEVGSYDGPDPDGHALFLTRRYAGHRQLVETGRGAWFAAYLPDGRPVSSLGVFAVSDGLARYQDVMTDVGHRRRGIAAALLRYAGRWALDRDDVRSLVIVADPEGPAIGVYRRAGFEVLAEQWALYRGEQTD